MDTLPVPIPGLKTVTVKIPFGAELINASSKTDHIANGASATVNWSIPVLGLYVSPRITFDRSHFQINVRPVGLGYYRLGEGLGSLGNAELTVSDRPGSLSLSAATLGYVGIVGIEFPVSKASLLVEGGYRSLQFSDVVLTPKNGFSPGAGGGVSQVGSLPQTLDYSGVIVRIGLGVHLF